MIAGWFEGTGAVVERFKTDDDRFGDMLRVTCDPGRNEPGILVLSHVDTVHPLGTLAGPCRCGARATRSTAPASTT